MTCIFANHSHLCSIAIENINFWSCPEECYPAEGIWYVINPFNNNDDGWVIGSDKFVFAYSTSTQCDSIKSEDWSSSSCPTREMSLRDSLANSNVAIDISIGRVNTPITTVIPSIIWYYVIVPLWRNNHILDAILCPDVHKHPLPVALQTPPKWQSTSHGASKVAKDSHPGTPAGFSQIFVIGLYA